MLHTVTSPHAHAKSSTGLLMGNVLIALIPGIIALTWFYGWGTLINLIWVVLLALGFEACVLRIRQRQILFYLRDGSALVTAFLFALAVPPYLPWWASLIGIAAAMLLGKHLYGGLGFNPFNPAMIGYVILLISFPVIMTQWPIPRPLLAEGQHLPTFLESLSIIFGSNASAVDGFTSPTALDLLKQNKGLLLEDLWVSAPLFSQARWNAVGTEWVNAAFLLGGIYLLIKRVYTWHAPAGMLGALVLLSLAFYDGGSSASHGSPIFQLLSGATMLGAFFIITDPVSGATSNLGRLIFGMGVGSVVFIIRAWGNYPDGVAFAVLLMNFAAPFIDYYTQPKTYGHTKRSRAKMSKK